MIVDTGASRTALPIKILSEKLNALPTTTRKVQDFDGNETLKDSFVIDLIIMGNMFHDMVIIGTDNTSHGLLGRDVLSKFILLCNGRKEKFKLSKYLIFPCLY